MPSSVSDTSTAILTFEEWCKWRSKELPLFRKIQFSPAASENQKEDERYLRNKYEEIAAYPNLTNHFLEMSEKMQIDLVLDVDSKNHEIMRDRVNMSILIHQLRIKNPENAGDWCTLDHVLTSHITARNDYKDSDEFRALEDAFLGVQQELKCINLNYASVTLTLLRLLYNERRVSEVVEAWITGSKTPDLLVLTKLVHQWDELKSLPVQWSISMIENELITNSDSFHRELV